MPAGWLNAEDLPGNFQLYRTNDPQEGAVGGSFLGIYQNVRAASITCAEIPQEGVGTAGFGSRMPSSVWPREPGHQGVP